MSILKDYREDLTLHDKGAPMDFNCEEGTIMYVRRLNHRWDDELFACKQHLFGYYFIDQRLTYEQRSKAVGLCIAEYLVAGWDNLFDEDGKPIPYSLSKAKQIFQNPEYALSLNNELIRFSQNHENFLYKELEKDSVIVKK